MPIELKHPRNGLINIKNKDQKCLLWCHVRHINPSKKHPGRIKKVNKKISEKLDYSEIEFPVKKKDFDMIEIKNNICINVFGYKNGLVFPIYVSSQKFDDSMVTNHTMCALKILTDLFFTKRKIKIKTGFARLVYNVLVVKMC